MVENNTAFEGLPCEEVRRSCRFIMENQVSVRVNEVKIDEFIQELEAEIVTKGDD